MKRLIIAVSLLISITIHAQSQSDLIGLTFRDFKELPQLVHYEKMADTSFVDSKNFDSFPLLHLKNEDHHLIIMSKEFYDDDNDGYPMDKIIDFIKISDVKSNQLIAVSYCLYKNKDAYSENAFALLEVRPDSKDYTISKAWKGNSITMKIEPIDPSLVEECDYLVLGTHKQKAKWKN